jgi:adenylate cyclase
LKQRNRIPCWTAHGCIGIYLWLRVKHHFHRFAPILLVIAVVLPTAAALGIYQGQRAVVEKMRTDPAFAADLRATGFRSHPEALAANYRIGDWCFFGYAALLTLLIAARGVRALAERRGGRVRIAYPDGRSVRIPKGLSVLDASRRGGIPHASICGGRARCTTCRVRVPLGSEHLSVPSPIEIRVLSQLGVDRAVRLACQLKPTMDISVWPLLPPEITIRDRARLDLVESGTERLVAILFVDIRSSTQLVEKRLPYDVVFILNRFFEAVGGAITAAGGMPNQFIGDGMMAIFGTDTDAAEACRRALQAARLIDWHLAEMNRALANELQQPIAYGIGIHAGEVIIGTMGYRQHAQMTAIGEAVHIASRLQELTKEYQCQLVVSDVVGTTAGVSLGDFPARQIQLRGLSESLTIRAIDKATALPLDRFQEENEGIEYEITSRRWRDQNAIPRADAISELKTLGKMP